MVLIQIFLIIVFMLVPIWLLNRYVWPISNSQIWNGFLIIISIMWTALSFQTVIATAFDDMDGIGKGALIKTLSDILEG